MLIETGCTAVTLAVGRALPSVEKNGRKEFGKASNLTKSGLGSCKLTGQQ